MCGFNRLGRTLGHTQLIGLGFASGSVAAPVVPGFLSKTYRLGEYRDPTPRDGDEGIPFPHFDICQPEFSQFLITAAVIHNRSAEIRAVVTPTEPNPFRSTFCGSWKPLSILLMLGHVGIVEQSVSNLIGHARSSGLRLDLAQLALATEATAHFIMALMFHDPFLSFHWAALPYGGFSAFICGAIVLTCSSTFLLAAFWCVFLKPVGNKQRE